VAGVTDSPSPSSAGMVPDLRERPLQRYAEPVAERAIRQRPRWCRWAGYSSALRTALLHGRRGMIDGESLGFLCVFSRPTTRRSTRESMRRRCRPARRVLDIPRVQEEHPTRPDSARLAGRRSNGEELLAKAITRCTFIPGTSGRTGGMRRRSHASDRRTPDP
jgi:hypothetical protein